MSKPLFVQDALRAGTTTLEKLGAELGIHARRHKEFPNLVLLKYDMIDSPMGNELVQQCRGLILDEADGWRCITRPFDKFFNVEEGHAAPIDWSTAYALEKVDGSLMQLYEYRGQWRVASSGSPDASGAVGGSGWTFADLFWDTFKAKGMELPDLARDGDLTFLFELTAPENRVVCTYGGGRKLTLLGVRKRVADWQEYQPEPFLHAFPNWKAVRAYYTVNPDPDVRGRGPAMTAKMLQDTFETMNPMEQEGYVVVDAEFRRVKVKHPGYVAAHHLRGSWSTRAALNVVRNGEAMELAAHFPEMGAQLEDIRARLDKVVAELEALYEANKSIAVQKDFALVVTKGPLQGAPLFMLRAGKVKNVREFIKDMNVDRLIKELGLKDEPAPAVPPGEEA